MGHNEHKNKRRLRGVAAGLAAVAAAFIPGAATASPVSLPQAAETDSRTAARLSQAESALAQEIARTDRATLGVFACDCAARIAPLYERFGGSAASLSLARARAIAASSAATRGEPDEPAARPPATAGALQAALASFEDDVVALENEVANEAGVAVSAKNALRQLAFERCEQLASAPANGAQETTREPPFRMFTVAMTAAEAIDEALLIAAGGSVSRVGSMCEAIAEAVFLDHVFRRGEPTAAVDAVFRELAWQRRHLRALRAAG
ncbi:MAG TPA: hypothetical protein VIQ54_05610 [Polyangia bacterium]